MNELYSKHIFEYSDIEATANTVTGVSYAYGNISPKKEDFSFNYTFSKESTEEPNKTNSIYYTATSGSLNYVYLYSKHKETITTESRGISFEKLAISSTGDEAYDYTSKSQSSQWKYVKEVDSEIQNEDIRLRADESDEFSYGAALLYLVKPIDNITTEVTFWILRGHYYVTSTNTEKFFTYNITVSITANVGHVESELTDLYPEGGKSDYSLETTSLHRNDCSYSPPSLDAGTIMLPKFLAQSIYEKYNGGKQVLTLLCDINTHMMQIEGSDGKATESLDYIIPIGTELVPYVHKGGVEVPLSVNENELPIKFEVVASRVYYDGAIFQELTLIESGIHEINKLSAPTITISGDTLTIVDTSELAEIVSVYVGGNKVATLEVPKQEAPKTTFQVEQNESGGYTYNIISTEYTVQDGVYTIGEQL